MKLRIWFASLWLTCIAHAGTLYQVSTLQALMEGRYDGVATAQDLSAHGNIGLGTFQALEGELIMVHGTIFQVLVDGTVREAPHSAPLPFACAAELDFSADGSSLGALHHSELETHINQMHPDEHLPVVIYVTGTFSRVTLRSVAMQERPFRPLSEAIKEQALFEYDLLDGELVGFRMPPFWNGVNVPGFHFHFISSDREAGGHVLDITVESGRLLVRPLRNAVLTLFADD